MKDFYSSMNQNNEHINQDLSLRWNKMSTQQQDLMLEQRKSNSWTSVGLTKDSLHGFQQNTAHVIHACKLNGQYIYSSIQTRAVRGSAYSPATALYEEKDELVKIWKLETEKGRNDQMSSLISIYTIHCIYSSCLYCFNFLCLTVLEKCLKNKNMLWKI